MDVQIIDNSLDIHINENVLDVVSIGTVIEKQGQDHTDDTFIAGENINGHKVVYLKNGKLYTASNDNLECINTIVGMSTSSALSGESIVIKIKGIVSLNLWGLIPNSIYYLGMNGNLTSIAPTSGAWAIMGVAIDANNFNLDKQITVKL